MVWFAFLLLVLVLLVTTCRNAGNWLVKENKPAHADVMVMLMGNIPDRVLEVADLYKEKVSGKLIIVEEYMGPLGILADRGVHFVSNSSQARNAAITLGIPADSILILPGNARSTQDEAMAVREYLMKKNNIRSILLVSSAEHTQRASLIFEKAFGKTDLTTTIYTAPSRYTGFRKTDWWKHKEEIQSVLFEYIKLMNFWIFDIHNL